MLYICTACQYMFTAEQPVTRCPDCGKQHVREATSEENKEYERRTATLDDWYEQPSIHRP